MNLRELLAKAEVSCAVKNGLLTKEQVTYCMAWRRKIGDQKRVMYNAMGPDLSTVLLTTNAKDIIGIDTAWVYANGVRGYIDSYWDEVDRAPILHPEAFWNLLSPDTPYKPDEERINRFNEDMEFRKAYGYWDKSIINRWDLDRLLVIEMKKLGVEPESVSVSENSGFVDVGFKWAYPEEEITSRTLRAFCGTIPQLPPNIPKVNCFYQKSFFNADETKEYLKIVLPFLDARANILVGKRWNENRRFKKEIASALGGGFNEMRIGNNYTSLVDSLPDEEYDPHIHYGMHLMGFKKEES